MYEVIIYTDGACKGNPGRGGYGIVLLFNDSKGQIHEKRISQGFDLTTNNRMELLAVIEALKQLKYPCKVNLYSDSKYVVDAINKGWIRTWKAQNYRKGKNNEVKNIDLWEELVPLLKKHKVKFNWVRGHDGDKYNEICDKLASDAAEG